MRLNTLLLTVLVSGFSLSSASAGAQDRGVDNSWPVIEHELRYNGPVGNPFTEIEAEAVYSGPQGEVKLGGFYAGASTWRFRFVTRVTGAWKASLTLKQDGRQVATSNFEFEVKEQTGKGFVRISRTNPYRFEYENGQPYYPIGIQVCGHDSDGLDGPPRGQGEWRTVSMESFLAAHREADNLFRIQLGAGTTAGCAWQVLDDPKRTDRYDLALLDKLDWLCRLLRRNGYSVILIMFQDMSLWGVDSTAFGTNQDLRGWKNPVDTASAGAVRQYLRYMVARYGAYVDIWELFNEDSYTPPERLRQMAEYVRQVDPYRHILTTSYERPQEPWCDLVTPHEYMWLPDNEIDQHLTHEFARFKSFDKPVLYTEFGNQGEFSNRAPVKWRIAVWTAFMNESAILFWSMGGIITPDQEGPVRGNSNAYLGPEARAYFKYFRELTRDLPVDMRPVMSGFGQKGDEIRRYALSNGRLTLLYLQHYTSHATVTKGEVYVWTGSGRFSVRWIDPATGETVSRDEAQAPGQILIVKTPEFRIDLAARIERLGEATR